MDSRGSRGDSAQARGSGRGQGIEGSGRAAHPSQVSYLTTFINTAGLSLLGVAMAAKSESEAIRETERCALATILYYTILYYIILSDTILYYTRVYYDIIYHNII